MGNLPMRLRPWPLMHGLVARATFGALSRSRNR